MTAALAEKPMSTNIARASSRIEFCGGIGAGKSTVARLLAAHCRLPLIEEHYEQVPFWKEFYKEPQRYAFEKNISFLMFHSNAIRLAVTHFQERPLICDFALFQDLAYASLAGPQEDYEATVAVHDRLMGRLDCPSLIIHVRCSVDEQLTRIKRRGREPERAITGSYLEQLSQHVDRELARYSGIVPIVEINTEQLDFVVDPSAGLAVLSSNVEKWLVRISE
jgi:deoxyadenosine/deoxycytidine kinase